MVDTGESSYCAAPALLGLRRSVVYDLLKRYRQRSQTSSLLPGKRGREPKVAVLGRDREQLLSSCIEEFYLRPERPRLSALMLEVRRSRRSCAGTVEQT
jgi:putative transposase